MKKLIAVTAMALGLTGCGLNGKTYTVDVHFDKEPIPHYEEGMVLDGYMAGVHMDEDGQPVMELGEPPF